MLQNDSPLSTFDDDEVKLAWKLGGTNLRSQKQFGNSIPLFGAVPLERIYFSGQTIPHTENTCIELEIAVKIPKEQTEDLEYALCFELPQKRLPAGQVDLAEVLLDRCGANALVVQKNFMRCNPEDLECSVFKMNRDKFEIEANTFENLVGTPRNLLFDFLNAAKANGASPLPGEIVAVGALGQCFPISSGERYAAKNEILGKIEISIA